MPRNGSGCGIQVNARGHLSWLDKVDLLFGPENMQRMRRSCFGHLFDVPDLHTQGQLYSTLLRKLDPSSHRWNILTFRLGNESVEFGPEQFASITGLQFNGPLETPTESIFHNEVFAKKLQITFMEYDARFCKASDEDGPDSELCFKLGLGYVVFGIFFIKERTSKCIDLNYMHLLDDVEAFMRYPWGAAAYEFLIRETHRAANKLTGASSGGNRIGVDAHGFVTALQCWAYEILPDLAKDVALKVCDVRLPRILRWCFPGKKIQFDTVKEYFKPSTLHLVPYEILPDEKPKLEFLGVAEYIDTCIPPPSTVRPKIRKRKLSFNETSHDTSTVPLCLRRSSRLGRDPSPATSKVGSSPCREGECRREVAARVEDLSRRFAEFQSVNSNNEIVSMLSHIEMQLAKIASLQTPIPVVINTPTAKPVGTVELSKADVTPTVNTCNIEATPSCQKILGSKIGFAANRLEKYSDDDDNEQKHVGSKQPLTGMKRKVGRPKGSKSKNFQTIPAAACSKRVTRRSTIRSSPSNVSVHCSQPMPPKLYDPFEADYASKAVVGQFQSWYLEAKQTKSEATVKLPCRLMRYARYNWFEPIWYPRNWLGSDQLDALINLLIYKQRQNPHLFLSGWTCLEQFGWVSLTNQKFEERADVLNPYLFGEFPHEGGLPWYEANVVYAIANVNNNHWVAVQILLDEQKLVVYNSISHSIDWSNVPTQFVTASKFIPWICRRTGVWARRNTSTPLRDQWDVLEYPSPPQQQNGSDCGVMAMKYIECLASGHSLDELDAERCSIYRRSYCGQLYEYGKNFYGETT